MAYRRKDLAPIELNYIGPVHRFPGRMSIFATEQARYSFSSPFVDPTSRLQHFGEGGGVGAFTADIGGMCTRLAGAGAGYVLGDLLLPLGLVGKIGGAVAGYLLGAGVARLGGE